MGYAHARLFVQYRLHAVVSTYQDCLHVTTILDGSGKVSIVGSIVRYGENDGVRRICCAARIYNKSAPTLSHTFSPAIIVSAMHMPIPCDRVVMQSFPDVAL